MRESRVSNDKIQAYLATDYFVRAGQHDLLLRIGTRCDQLSALFQVHAVDCGAFITAFNPRGTLQSDQDNQQAHRTLASRIATLNLHTVEGAGRGADGEWPPEKSLFVFGLPLAQAKQLGTEFDQDAIVWVGADCVPQLVVLR